MDDLADLGEVVEQGEELVGVVAVVEAEVELVADVGGEAGDFAAALGGGRFGVVEIKAHRL